MAFGEASAAAVMAFNFEFSVRKYYISCIVIFMSNTGGF